MKNKNKPDGSVAKGIFLGLVFWVFLLITVIFVDLNSNFFPLFVGS